MISFKIVALLLKQLLYYAELLGGGELKLGRSSSNKLINLGAQENYLSFKSERGSF